MRFAGALVLLSALPPFRLSAQCPNGAPPPCAGARPPAPNSVAVLYFDNLSRDSGDAFLADGLTEELIVRLGQVPRLDVKSRFVSQRARGRSAEDPRVLGRTLGASWLVTGSLQQQGQRVRLRVGLVRAANGRQAWGEVYDRSGDVFTIQSDIAREVAGAITGQLLPDERATLARRPTRDPLAYDLYLRGVGALNGTDEPTLHTAIELFDRAIARDSSFADAWAQKASAWTWVADGYVPGRVGYARSREAARRALQLDSTQAVAWAMISQAAAALDRDARSALAAGQRAVQLNPRRPEAHLALNNAQMLAGIGDKGLGEGERGWLADTLNAAAAFVYLYTVRYVGDAAALPVAVARVRPTLGPEDARQWDGVALLRGGDATGAAERLSWTYYGGANAGDFVRALVATGRRDQALAVVDSMTTYAQRTYYNAYALAGAQAALGNTDEAFRQLDNAWEQRTIWLVGVAYDPGFTVLHDDPRWAAFLRKIGPN